MRFNVFSKHKPASAFALAIALACGTAVTAVGFAEPAFAQKKKKKKGEPAPFSKEFVEAYKPIEEALKQEGADLSGYAGQVESIIAMSQTPDEKLAGGQLGINVGSKTNNLGLQLSGIQSMLASGKLPAEELGKYNFFAYQISNQIPQRATAREYLIKAADLGYSFQAQVSDGSSKPFAPDDIRLMVFESYVDENQLPQAFDYLRGIIEQRKAAGGTVHSSWLRRGLSVANQESVASEMENFAVYYASDLESETKWRDAVATIYNRGGLNADGMLDLLRLARRTDALQNDLMYGEYIDSADPRKLPEEVVTLIDEGYAAGILARGDGYIKDARDLAQGRIAADKRELPALERDARSASAGLRTVVAAGDTFLSYGENGKAAEF